MTDKEKLVRTTMPLGVYQVPPATMERLTDLLQAIRDANYKPPARGVLLSALIYSAPTDGEQLLTEYLAPYLRDHPEEEKPPKN